MNWGIVGLGYISNKFAEALNFVDSASLFAVASRNMKKAQVFAKKHKAKIVYDDYEDLFKNENVDIVYIGTPHVFHFENAISAMEQGKTVLCEKPIAMNKNQAIKMFDCAKVNNVFLMEAMWTRFIPSFVEVKKLIDKGKIGTIKNIKADFGFQTDQSPQGRLFNPALGGGSILDVGIYPIFLTLQLLGMPNQIKALANLNNQGTDDACNIIFKYDNAMASLTSSVVCNQTMEASIFGTKGTIKLNFPWYDQTSISIIKDFNEVEKINFDMIGNGMQYQAAEVQNCIKQGKIQSNLMPWKTSLQLQEIMDAIRVEVGVTYKWD